ncbi:MAG: large conductance mechanosensitive channel protein MscL [Clostridia bacterium]|nr:large conductance mechanosensitive channel protein MscL [Clostridia bacterium]MBQ6613857.1 large conductance mechanosensitive channel protein MscL [Clostridia bacterium]
MGKFGQDFKAFISKGNVVDMAVGVVVGGAFNKIVTSLVNDIIMPLVGLLVGGLNVSDWKWVIKEAVLDAEGAVVTAENAVLYGNFIQNIIDFLIVAFTIFVVLRVFTKLQKKKDAE